MQKGVRLADTVPRSGSGRNVEKQQSQEARTDSPPIPSTRKTSKKNASGNGNGKKSKPAPPPSKSTKRKKRIIIEAEAEDVEEEEVEEHGTDSAVAAFEREERKERERFERSESIESFGAVPPPPVASKGPRKPEKQWMTMDAEEEEQDGQGNGDGRSGDYEGDDERGRRGTTGSGSADFFSGEADPGFDIFEDAEE